MSALSPIPSDFTSRTLSLTRASQLFPTLGISIIESRERPGFHLGSSLPEWTGKPDALLADCGHALYDTVDRTVEVHVRRGVPIYHRERLYAIALAAAVHGPDHAENVWTVQDDGVLSCSWLGRWDDDQVADDLMDELQGATKEGAR